MMRRVSKLLTISVFSLLIFILVLECAYRYQLFDFYKAELKNLNPSIQQKKNKTILICGDSFTADPTSYVSVLRDSLPQFDIINIGVPGTGIRQHALYLPGRIKKYKPDVFIYQFYVGNDLFDIRHPYQSDSISQLRKMYWYLSDKIISLAFLNFRFAGLRYPYLDDAGGNYSAKTLDSFSIESYSRREKFNYRTEPGLIENTLYLKNGRDRDWNLFKSTFSELINMMEDSVKKYFVFIPHESMLAPSLMKKHISLGARFSLRDIENNPLLLELQSFCKDNDIHFIDFSHPEVDTSLIQKLYYPNDPHLNRVGQLVLGKKIFNEIIKNEF